MTDSRKMLWVCATIIAVVLVLALAAGSAGYLLFALPCVLMMGGMMWMMMRGAGAGRGAERGDQDPR